MNSINTPQTLEIPVGERPISVAFSKDGKRAFVCHATNKGEISVIDVGTSELIQTIHVGSEVRAIAVSPDDKRIVVCNQGGAWIINAETLAIRKIDENLGADRSVEFSPDGKFLYFPRMSIPQLVVLNTTTMKAVQSIEKLGSPKSIAISPNKSRVYIAVDDSSEILVFETNTNTGELTPRKKITVGSNPTDLAITRDGELLCVCNETAGTITFVDLKEEEVVETFNVRATPIAIALSSDGHHAYVALGIPRVVSVIDIKRFEEVERLPSPQPFDVAVNPAGTLLYVANLDGSSISVVKLTDQS